MLAWVTRCLGRILIEPEELIEKPSLHVMVFNDNALICLHGNDLEDEMIIFLNVSKRHFRAGYYHGRDTRFVLPLG